MFSCNKHLEGVANEDVRTQIRIFDEHKEEDAEEFSHLYDNIRFEMEYPLSACCIVNTVNMRSFWFPRVFPRVFLYWCKTYLFKKNCRPYNLYCVGGDVKPCSINHFRDINESSSGWPQCLMVKWQQARCQAGYWSLYRIVFQTALNNLGQDFWWICYEIFSQPDNEAPLSSLNCDQYSFHVVRWLMTETVHVSWFACPSPATVVGQTRVEMCLAAG